MSEETHFGFARVPLQEKQAKVDAVFHNVASRYDLMNDLMSGGLHRVWKDIFASQAQPARRGKFRHLDVAGGTGDIAFRIAQAGGAQTEITVLDINADMLEVGRARAKKKNLPARLEFVQANAEDLPFPDNAFDAYTIAFGIRNVPRIDRALAEARRVLKRGGRFLCLEFSRSRGPSDRPALRGLFVPRHSAPRPMGDGRSRLLSLSGRIDRALSGRRKLSRADRGGGIRPRRLHPADRRRRRIHSGWKL